MPPLKRRIRWGVIGAGGIARRRTIPEGILPAKNAELVAVYGRNPRTRAAVARQFGVRAARSLDELLKLDLDAVYIATPNCMHLEQTCQAAGAGKHVFCEKPLGLTVAEARRMVQVCRKAKVNLGTAFMMRYHSQHQAALRMIQEGRLGQPVFARAQLSCWYPPLRGAWRQNQRQGGGGAVMDLAGHCLDLLEMYFGPIASVSCMLNHTVHKYSTEDSGAILARFRNGVLAAVDTCFCIPDDSSKNRLELYGSRGSILAQDTIGQGDSGEMVAFLEGGSKAYAAKQSRRRGGGLIVNPKPVNTYRAEIEDFSQALIEGRDTNESAQAGLHSQVILEACYESAKAGRERTIAGR
ncbi:MAG: Gfo/Idh/MocA family oxidoreductase [Verrucomicrobiae bacterium]|nr:Gfo/Idh/MocA family oxidoreductase [Verrucomicrobiae bacterium]